MHDRVRALLMPCMHQEAMRGARAPRRHSIAKLLGRYMHNMSCLCMYPSIYPLILLYMVHYMCISLCIYIYIVFLSCAGKCVCDELARDSDPEPRRRMHAQGRLHEGCSAQRAEVDLLLCIVPVLTDDLDVAALM